MLYQYKCRICGCEFDDFQPMGARDFDTCPKCSCVAEKKLTPPNFSFGFTLSEESRFVPYKKDELVRDV